jgi:hypothetical protein
VEERLKNIYLNLTFKIQNLTFIVRRRLDFFSGIINDFGVIKKERNAYGETTRH